MKHPLGKKESLGIDTLVVDQATPHHMIFPALLTVCEDAIHLEWIGSAVYRHKICDAPINTQDVQTFIIASFCSALPVTSRPPRLFAPAHICVSRICQQDKSTHTCFICFCFFHHNYSLRFLLYVKYAFKEARRKE